MAEQFSEVPTIIKLNDCQLDVASGVVTRPDQVGPIRINPKSVDVLVYLARNQAQLVTRDQLLDTVWNYRVVTESQLTKRIAEIRAALGDQKKPHRYIETLPKRGYRLICNVHFSATRDSGSSDDVGSAWFRSWSWGNSRMFTGSILFVLITSFVLAMLMGSGFPLDDNGLEYESAGPTATILQEQDPKYFAVMPFEDLSPDQDQAWLASGMTESLIDSLNRIQGLRVAGLQSASLLHNNDAGLAEIGQTLGVGSVVYGSIQRVDEDLRVMIRWEDIGEQISIWSTRFERPFDDVFAVQREISAGIAEAIRQELGVDQPLIRSMEFSRYEFDNVRLWEMWRRSEELWLRAPTDENARLESEELCQRATRIDPEFAPGYACLGWLAKDQKEAVDYARRALEIDPMNVDAHRVVAKAEIEALKLHSAERRLGALISSYPFHGSLRSQYVHVLQALGRIDEATDQARQSVALEPLIAPPRTRLGQSLLMSGQNAEALAQLEHAMALHQPSASLLAIIAHAYERAGREEDAVDALLKHFQIAYPENDRIQTLIKQGFSEGGYRGAWAKFTDYTNQQGFCNPTYNAMAGNREIMFECLDQRFERLATWNLVASLSFSEHRNEQQFQELIQQRERQIRKSEELGLLVPLPSTR